MNSAIFLFLLLPLSSFAEPVNFPNTIVEHVGAGQSDILHCLLEGKQRQSCKVGWGEAFRQLKQLKINAPEAYGSALLIPEITETPFGPLSSAAVIQRLQGSLWNNWKIAPRLNFVLDWSNSEECWSNDILKSSISVQVNGKQIGIVEPGLNNYQFPLTDPAGERSWTVISPLDSNQERVKWSSHENERAIATEFDFSLRGADRRFPFSPVQIPNKCRIILSNVQTVLDRNASDRALDSMEAKAIYTVELMVSGSLNYAALTQSAEGVKCVIAMQLESLRRSEDIPFAENSRALSDRAQTSLKSALKLTSHLTSYDMDRDALEFLDTHRREWLNSCVSQTAQGLDQFKVVPENAPPEIKLIIENFLGHKATLQKLLEDAWPLAVLLKIVNDDNRRLKWMIDSTVTYKLKSQDVP